MVMLWIQYLSLLFLISRWSLRDLPLVTAGDAGSSQEPDNGHVGSSPGLRQTHTHKTTALVHKSNFPVDRLFEMRGPSSWDGDLDDDVGDTNAGCRRMKTAQCVVTDHWRSRQKCRTQFTAQIVVSTIRPPHWSHSSFGLKRTINRKFSKTPSGCLIAREWN